MKLNYEIDMFLETEKVKQIYPLAKEYSKRHKINMYLVASVLNELTLPLKDNERLMLAIKLIEDFPNQINNKKLFIDTFTRRL